MRGKRMNYSAIIFDLDGTLLDTLADLADSFNHALTAHQFPAHPVSAYRIFIGDGARTAVERALPQTARNNQTVEIVLQEFKRHYAQNFNNKTRPYPGILSLIEKLKSKDIRMAVLSNKPHDFTIQCTDYYFKNKFDLVQGFDNRFPKKPEPQSVKFILGELGLKAEEALYVGDTKTDMATARNADITSVGVVWGFRDERELRESGANYIIHHPGEILQVLNNNRISR